MPLVVEHLSERDGPASPDPSLALKTPYRKLSPRDARAAPNKLLRAEHGCVPLMRPNPHFDLLLDWSTRDSATGLALVTGPAGIGKTRLASELCLSRLNAGWVAGLLMLEPAEAGLDGLSRAEGRLLVVVDRAEGRVDQIIGLLGKLSERSAAKPWRVLLLARSKGDWWLRLSQKALESPADQVVAAVAEYELHYPQASQRDTQIAFREAAECFGTILGIPTGHLRVPHLESSALDRPLFLQMAALSALGAPASSSPSLAHRSRITQAALLDDALERERQYWQDTASAAGLERREDASDLASAVAIATLAGARNEDEAQDLLTSVPGLSDQPQADRRLVARWLHGLYPGEPCEWFRAIEPDLLAEAHLAAVIEASPSIVERLLTRTDGEHDERVLRALAQGAPNYRTLRVALEDALSANLDRLWLPAVEIAQEVGDPVGQILANVVARDPRASVVDGLSERLPIDTIALRELCLVVAQARLAIARDRHDGDALIADAQRPLDQIGSTGPT